MKETALRWFYRLLDLDTPTLRQYPPLRVLFAELLPVLLRTFVNGDSQVRHCFAYVCTKRLRWLVQESIRTLSTLVTDPDRVVRLAPCLQAHSSPAVLGELYDVMLEAEARLPPAVSLLLCDSFDVNEVRLSLLSVAFLVSLWLLVFCSGCARIPLVPVAPRC